MHVAHCCQVHIFDTNLANFLVRVAVVLDHIQGTQEGRTNAHTGVFQSSQYTVSTCMCLDKWKKNMEETYTGM